MSNIVSLNDGSLGGVIGQINALHAQGKIEKMIIIITRNDQDPPQMSFCLTDLYEELGLLELAKLQALKTRDIIE